MCVPLISRGNTRTLVMVGVSIDPKVSIMFQSLPIVAHCKVYHYTPLGKPRARNWHQRMAGSLDGIAREHTECNGFTRPWPSSLVGCIVHSSVAFPQMCFPQLSPWAQRHLSHLQHCTHNTFVTVLIQRHHTTLCSQVVD